MMVILGTVASANAYNSLAPCLMMPPNSCLVPGRNPGTSSNTTSGMLNASQNLTKRAPLSDASMSSVPASTAGWFATSPTVLPSSRANPTTRLRAYSSCSTTNRPSSTTMRISSVMSYGWLGLSGTRLLSRSSAREGSSVGGRAGGSSMLFEGRYDISSRMRPRQALSSATAKCATPDTAACVWAPPSCSLVTSSCVTVLMTSGPVMNMYDVPSTMMLKSVIAGE